MAKYDVKSKNAEEFINHEEILESLDYGREHKNDRKLIKEILEKAKKAQGLSPVSYTHLTLPTTPYV